ncbi:MAG: ferrous iron transport protein B [Candidatus Zixiibacteriota bacterium]|nr:MAG: ferrous iron transport protein B [candidate division Zixibacteria bacterium]
MTVAYEKSVVGTGLIALCGNPNSGKTTIFNALTGLSQQVANYPGVTVEKVSGKLDLSSEAGRSFTLVDVPGAYSLSAFSPDEYIAALVLFGGIKGQPRPEAVLCVIDATQLERGLYLLLQILQIGCPAVVALNMVDLARRSGLRIIHHRLSKMLGGVPVVPVVGNRRRGLDKLRQQIAGVLSTPRSGTALRFDEITEAALDGMVGADADPVYSRARCLRVLYDEEGPAETEFVRERGETAMEPVQRARERIRSRYGSLASGETRTLTDRASEIFESVVRSKNGPGRTRSEKVDRFLLHPVLGPLVLALLMILVFQSIFSWAAPFMEMIDGVFASLAAVVEKGMPPGPLRSLVTDGIIGGVGSVLIFVPQIAILFIFIALLEDSGYMPRAAFLVDRLFRWCGLSGKSFIPMLSSFACAIPGIMATRTIEDRKLRFITIMVAPLMTCSARLPVYAIMIAAFIPYKTYLGLFNLQGIVLTMLYLLGMVVAVIVSYVLKKLIFRTEQGTFMMEMPSYKLPTLRSISVRVVNRIKSFVVRAGTVILAITVIIWALSYYPRPVVLAPSAESPQAATVETVNEQAGQQIRGSYLGMVGRKIEPVFAPLGWDWKITVAVLAAFPAREVVIATLGTIYNLGTDVEEQSSSLVEKMRKARWEEGSSAGKPVFSPAVALSIMVFFALCCQCGATLVTIRQETTKWIYAVATFAYMTVVAYAGAAAVYQVFSRWGL